MFRGWTCTESTDGLSSPTFCNCYRKTTLTVRRRGCRKRTMGMRHPLGTPLVANQR